MTVLGLARAFDAWEAFASRSRAEVAAAAREEAEQATLMRARHRVAARAIAKMGKLSVGKAWCGWEGMVAYHRRQRQLLRRGVARFTRQALAQAFDAWAAWIDSARRLQEAALALAATHERVSEAEAARIKQSELLAQLQSQLEV